MAQIADLNKSGTQIPRDESDFQARNMSMFKLGIERSSEAIFLTDIEGKILYVNPAFERIYGFSKEEAIGQTPRILKSGKLSAATYTQFWKGLLQKEIVSREIINKAKDGRLLTIDASVNPVLDNAGELLGFLAIQRDITERKQVEETEKAKAAFLSGLVGLTNAQEICKSAFEFIRKIMPCDAGAVILEKDNKYSPAFEVVHNFDTNEDGSLTAWENREAFELDPSMYLAEVFRSGQAIIVHRSEEDLQKVEPKAPKLFIFNNRPSRSLAYLPLKFQDLIVGVITVQSYSSSSYNEAAVKILEFVASNLVMALMAVKASENLRESEERFRGVFENATIGLYRTTPDGRILLANPALIWMLGYKSFEDLAKKNLEVYGHSPKYPRSVFKKMMEMMGVVHGLESSWKKADGNFVQVLESACAIKDKNGDVIYYEGTVEDISERKRVEEALHTSEERYKLLIENANDAILVIQDGKVIYTNRKALEIVGLEQQEILNKPFADYIHPNDRTVTIQRHKARLAGDKLDNTYIIRVLHKDGSVRWIEINAVKIEWSGNPATLNFGRDITERKRVEEELKFRNLLLSTQQEAAIDGILVVNDSGDILSYNQRFIDLWNIPSEILAAKIDEPVLKAVTDKIADPHQFINKVTYLYQHQNEISRDELALKDGRTFDRYSAPMIAEDGKYYGRIWFFRDITKQKKAEEALRASEERYKLLIENASDAIFVVRDYKIIYANFKLFEIIGYNEQDIVDKPFAFLIHPDDREMVTRRHEARMAGEQVESIYTFKVLHKDGGTRWLEINAVKIDWYGKPATLNFGRDVTERRLAEAQLQVEKAYFEQLFESAPEAIVIGDIDGKVTRTNPEFTRMFGYPQEEAIGNLIDDMLAPGEHRQEANSLTEKAASGEAICYEGIRYRKDGQPVHVSILGTPISTGEGQIAVYAIYRNITEQKKAEELNQARAQFLAELVGLTDASELATLAFDRVRYLMPVESGALSIAINDQAKYEQVFSADTDESGQLTAMTNRGYITMDSNSSTEQVFRGGKKMIIHRTEEEASQVDPFIEGMPAYNARISRSLAYFPLIVHGQALGVFSFLSYQPDVFTAPRITLLESIMADLALALTAIRMTEALRGSEEKYRNLVETMPNGLLKIDLDFNINFANPMACEMCGHPLYEILNMNFCQIVKQDSLDIFMEQMLKRRNGESGEYEIQINRGDGETRTIFIMGAPMRDRSGAVTGAIGICSDITEVRKSEIERQELREKLARAQKMESLGVLAGGVAHDLNNILGPLVAYPELIRMKLPPDSPVIKQISKIESSAQRAAEVVQDLLTMARRGRYEMKPISINKVVESYLQSPDFHDLKLRFPNVTVNIDLDRDNRLVYGSEPHLYKVIINLAMNAMDAMPHGGELAIRTECRNVERLIGGFDNIESGLYNILTVSDTGIGIDQKDLKRLFEPFYTKKVMGKSGSGLGLAIVYGVVKDHNGYIDVRSEANKGSEFIVYIPTTTEITSGEEREPISIKGNERILIVDDVLEQRELATTILGSLEYKAESVPDGHAAVEYLKNTPVDVVVLDMIMEPGFDGLDTYKAILELCPGQKAIITSGYSETDRVKEAERLGVGKYIRKPYTMQKLGKAIREVLDVPAAVTS